MVSYCKFKKQKSTRTWFPFCNFSKGERAIIDYCNSKNIEYIPQFRFENSSINLSKFDFLINDKLIEFHGEQHYIPTTFNSREANKSDLALIVEKSNSVTKITFLCL